MPPSDLIPLLYVQVLSTALKPISLVHYPETYLPPPPEDEDLVSVLLDDWDTCGIPAQNAVYPEETLDHDEDVIVWMGQAKKAMTEAGRRFARRRMIAERGELGRFLLGPHRSRSAHTQPRLAPVSPFVCATVHQLRTCRQVFDLHRPS